MRKSLLLYLFILAVLFNVYTYVFLNKQVLFEQERYEKLKTHKNDSIKSLKNMLDDASYFALKNNDHALDYFENSTTGEYFTAEQLEPFIIENLMNYNALPDGNPYVGFEKINGSKPIVNKATVINHRWVLVDYAIGNIWGEALIKYFINEDKTISFENAETVIYPKSGN